MTRDDDRGVIGVYLGAMRAGPRGIANRECRPAGISADEDLARLAVDVETDRNAELDAFEVEVDGHLPAAVQPAERLTEVPARE